ncbi:hypothetical protein AAL_05327 [Moelleriella libera RCEF 2490]|uniref:Uncharacterized protein n=1 Tax=Moelleriella libera RCEF 2490 TaxID=1081109 RepID=A0A166P4D0_9HYPO|nr:hypothetical protein AAL_05327 [Moelleriella libera RCEF 2490]
MASSCLTSLAQAQSTLLSQALSVTYIAPRGARSAAADLAHQRRHSAGARKSGIDDTLTTVGEHVKDYIRFTYGSASWTLTTTNGDASCKLVGNNWNKDGLKGCANSKAIVSLLHADVDRKVLLTAPRTADAQVCTTASVRDAFSKIFKASKKAVDL